MNETRKHQQYRGDGTRSDGRPAPSFGENGCYLADENLVAAVNAMLIVEQPLLITGKPGTGKTALAYSIAAELDLGKVKVFSVRSDHQGRELLYQFDNLQRLHDAQVRDEQAKELKNYLRLGALGEAIDSGKQCVVLIDEIDKAPHDFPNDLLHTLDRMEIDIPELKLTISSSVRPVVVITSNSESRLPDQFLRRCVFHYIDFPGPELLRRILDERLGDFDLSERLRGRIVEKFLALRAVPGLQKEPSTSEMLIWARLLAKAGVPDSRLEAPLAKLPHLGTMIKTRDDMLRVYEHGA